MAFVLTFLLRRLSQGIVIVLLVGFVIFRSCASCPAIR